MCHKSKLAAVLHLPDLLGASGLGIEVGVEVELGLDGIHIVQLGIHCHLPADNGREAVIGLS
jgi:hypothetical protein